VPRPVPRQTAQTSGRS